MISSLFSPVRVLSIAKKEVKHILRDPFTLALAMGIPIILVTFFGFIIDLNYRDIRISFQDRDNSRISRTLLETFSSSGYFILDQADSPYGPLRAIETEKASAVLFIEPGLGKDISTGKRAKVQIVLDGADNAKTGAVLNYLGNLFEKASKKLSGDEAASGLKIETRFLFNPELNSRWFIVPGLIVIIIGLLSILLTALTVAREWENGSMELLLATPVQPIEIIIGKLLPYILLAFSGIVFVYAVSRILFHVPFRGSHLIFSAACMIFILSSLMQGLLISVITRQQQLAMQISIISGLLPSLLLSGFVFPIESMPAFFQYFTGILAPRWFMFIIRTIFLKGAGLFEILKPFSALLTIATVLTLLATKKFKRDLEP